MYWSLENVPWTNLHDLNLDWIVNTMKQTVEQWIAYRLEMNQKYADFTKQINTDFDNFTTQINTWKTLIENEFSDLQTYVQNYFDNLDLNESTRYVINQMIASGEFIQVLNPSIVSATEAWLASHITPTTPVIDDTLSISGAAADAKATGDSLAYKDDELMYLFDNTPHSNLIVCTEIQHGYGYSSADGVKNPSASFCCSSSLLKVDGQHVYIAENVSQNITITCYGKNKNFLGKYTARPRGLHIYPQAYKNTAYIGLTTAENANITKLVLRQLVAPNAVEYPFSDPNYCFVDNWYYNAKGAAESSPSWACVNLCDLTPGDKYYTNSRYETNFVCFDEDDNVLTVPYVSIPYNGRVYTIPSGAKFCWCNIEKSKTHGDNSVIYYKITQPDKILAIGDSITWLDNRSGYDNATSFLGWQKQLQKAGYYVETAGFSGYSYATGTQGGSIYTEIVTHEYDVSGFDYIILFGGTNDDLYSVAIGDRCTNYSQTAFDASTFNGALSGIIKYIRDQNPTCKIILCSIIKSESSARPFAEAITYVKEIEYNSVFWSCFYSNLFRDMNVSPFTDGFDDYYYDNTHPNKAGMKRLGELILKAIEEA